MKTRSTATARKQFAWALYGPFPGPFPGPYLGGPLLWALYGFSMSRMWALLLGPLWALPCGGPGRQNDGPTGRPLQERHSQVLLVQQLHVFVDSFWAQAPKDFPRFHFLWSPV